MVRVSYNLHPRAQHEALRRDGGAEGAVRLRVAAPARLRAVELLVAARARHAPRAVLRPSARPAVPLRRRRRRAVAAAAAATGADAAAAAAERRRG